MPYRATIDGSIVSNKQSLLGSLYRATIDGSIVSNKQSLLGSLYHCHLSIPPGISVG